MRHPLRCLLLLTVALLPLGCRKAQTAAGPGGSVVMEDVRVGLPAVNPRDQKEASLSRNAAWAPVYIKLKAGKEGVQRDRFRVAVRTTDVEDTSYVVTVAVPALEVEEGRQVIAYVQPGNTGSEVNALLQTEDGRTLQTLTFRREAVNEMLEPHSQLFLAIDGIVPTLKDALLPPNPKEEQKAAGEERDRRYAVIQNVSQLPDRWIGYDAVDVAVLVTDKDKFIEDLSDPREEKRREALLEWVRRGGKLILSVGRNRQLIADWLDPKKKLLPLIDCEIRPAALPLRPAKLGLWVGAPGFERETEVAEIVPREGSDVQVLVRETRRQGSDVPLVVQGSCGLGRVLLVGFDLEGDQFANWAGRAAFWDKVIAEFGPHQSRQQHEGDLNPRGQILVGERRPELSTWLQHGLETFQGVTTISFGWVALFILVYIVIVGPLDYFLLKKVFKRLELTWLTFPAVVLTVSVTAYLAAYFAKGDDLRVNKIDLVELDLHGNRAYGSTWFALYSPRIRNYTVAVQPAGPEGDAPGWFPPPPDDAQPARSWRGPAPAAGSTTPAYPAVLSVLGAPERATRNGTPTLSQQAYEYADELAAVDRIPIPIWATRAFHASWAVPLPKEKRPVDARGPQSEPYLILDARAVDDMPRGTITNHLPCTLDEVTLFYQGEAYKFGSLAPEEQREVGLVLRPDRRVLPRAEWFNRSGDGPLPGPFDNALSGATEAAAQERVLKALMFHGEVRDQERGNSGLRSYDQSWRLRAADAADGTRPFRGEVLLVARIKRAEGPGEGVARNGLSPSRLWLDALPGTQAQRPRLDGYLTQDTYVRVYVPVVRRSP